MKPLVIVNLFSTSSGEGEDRWRIKAVQEQGKKTEEESEPLISLGLGIGGPTSNRRKTDEREKDNSFGRIVMVKEEKKEVDDRDQVAVEREGCKRNSVVRFTEDQVEELKRQLLVFKYLVWGLPVPFQLLLPHFHLYKRSSPPFFLAFSRGSFDHHRQMIDPEPGRCRRTDGKKWRCHQSVIPNEKYCEKHMHRGSKCSRKLVEASPCSRTPNLINLNHNINLNYDTRPKFSENLGRKEPIKVLKRAQHLSTSTATSYGNKKNNEGQFVVAAKDRIAVINQTLGLDFSPKSVLQNGIRCPIVQSCMNNPESESRCKRTDGKKWQCKKEVLPYQKYCAQHVNRGKFRSKKRSLASSASRDIQAAYGSISSSKTYGTGQAKVGLGLDTKLKFSLSRRQDDPRNMIKERMAQNGGSSSSTEATETDDSTGVVSP